MVHIGILGYGYWGPNLVRNFFQLDTCVVDTVCDLKKDRILILKKIYPSISTTQNPNDILTNKNINAVVIATPVKSHFELAKLALLNGKHVLIEKPITTNLRDAEELGRIAKKKKKVLMVDHTFLYTDAVQKIKKMINAHEIGRIQYFDSTRTNLGLFHNDINVLWDLASHDIAILNYLVNEKPAFIQANGISHTDNKINNIGFLTIKYRSGLIAHFNCSWSFPVKIRTIIIGGDKKMIVYNDVEPSEKLKIYDKGYAIKKNINKNNVQIDYREGDIYLPKIELKEALYYLANDFIRAIQYKTKPVSGWETGYDVVKILEYADISLKKSSKEVPYV